MTFQQPADPPCHRAECDESNHCEHHEAPVHHAVDSLAKACAKRARRRLPQDSAATARSTTS